MKIFVTKPVGQHDVGLQFIMKGNKIPLKLRNKRFEIVKFRSKATVNPYVLKDLETNELSIAPMTDCIIEQIRKGIVTELK